MNNERAKVQETMEVVMLEQLVPQDHVLRKIDKYIDFSFIRELTYDLYCHTNGRPGIDPVILFKMIFIGYLFGIRSERQLVKDIEVNLSYRWFLGYSITEKIPDASTISQNNIIVDVHVTPGNVSDSDPILNRIDRIIDTFDFKNRTKYIGLDAGYSTNPIFKGLADRELHPVIAYRRSLHQKGMFTKNKFLYDFENDIYICPSNHALIYKTTTREGYREYRCFEELCSCCIHKEKCKGEKSKYKVVRRHVWEDHKDDNKNFLKTEKGKGIYKRRKETIERSFADSKNLHGLRYAHMRGNQNVFEQCLLTAAVQNMKKIASKISLLKNYYYNTLTYIFDLKNYLYKRQKTSCFFKQGVFQHSEIYLISISNKYHYI